MIRNIGRLRARQSSLDAAIFALFAAGEQGAWYDPSDFSTLFQDSAGTTPVTAVGQPVGRMLDKSGRGNHAIQATATSRPVLQSASGLYYLACDGVDDGMATAGSVDFTGTDKMTVCCGVRKLSDTAWGIIELTANPDVTAGGFRIGEFSTGPRIIAAQTGGNATAVSALDAIVAAPATYVQTMTGDLSAPLVRSRLNGGSFVTNSGVTGGGNFANALIYLFRRGGTTLPFNGQFHGGIIRGAASSAQQIAQMEGWANSKTGAY